MARSNPSSADKTSARSTSSAKVAKGAGMIAAKADTPQRNGKVSAKTPQPAPAKTAAKPVAKSASKTVAEKPVPATKTKPVAKAMSPRAPRAEADVAKVPARTPIRRKKVAPKTVKPQGRPELLDQPMPETYGMDRLVALPKDPEWTHLYWELKPETQEALRSANNGTLPAFHVRGFDTTDILFDGANAPVSLDFEVAPYARSWYVRLPYQGRVYTFEYGHVAEDGQWKGILRSQPIGFNDGMADVSAEEWVNIGSEELFRFAAGLGEGEGINDLLRRLRDANSAGGAAWLTSWGSGAGRLEIAPSSFGLSSWQQAAGLGLSSWTTSPMGSGVSWGGSSPMGIPGRPETSKDFWLWVETEIILYGATEPDAKVTLNGKHLQLNPDGTFRLQFPFPDGTLHDFHVKAVDRDGDQTREARPAARRWTER